MSIRPLSMILLVAALAVMLYVAFSERDDPQPPGPAGGNGAQPTAAEEPAGIAPAAATGDNRTALEGVEAAPAGAFLRGRVTGPDGAGLADARVRLVPSGGFLMMGLPRAALAEGMVACRRDGSFSLPLPDGVDPLSVAALAPGFAAQRVHLVDREAPVTLKLEPSVSFGGLVVDLAGSPVADAQVHLSGPPVLDGLPAPAETGADGAFRLEAPGAGSYRLVVRSAAGEDAELDPLEVTPGMAPLRIEVRGAGGVIVRVHQRSGAPVEGARVSLRSTQPQTGRFGPKVVRSGADGVARIYSVDRGTWILTVTAPGYSEVVRRHTQRDAGPTQIPVELTAPGALEVLVVDRDGVTAADFEVQLHGDDSALRMQAGEASRFTDAEGVVRWDPVSAGLYRVVGGGDGWQVDLEGELAGGDSLPKAEGFGSSVVAVEVLPGATSQAELRLMGHARLLAEVVGAAGPVANAEVLLHQRGVAAAHAASRGVTGENGVALMPPVRPNRYQVTVALEGGQVQVIGEGITIDEATESIQIVLPTGEAVGRLVSTDGPVAGARIELAGAGAPGTWALTAADGSFLLPNLPKGEFLLKAVVDGYLPWTSPPFGCDGQGRVDLGTARLDREAVLQGRVTGLPPETQQGFSFRVVELHDLEGVRIAVSSLESGDRFTFTGLRPGSYRLLVTAAGRTHPAALVELEEGQNRLEIEGD
ncbi:MAG: carboxypeptidase regulatory-like domain-containing protein [Planctomycetes bacterium]|nr:carboxypeptidase regulatory-like domain-containing protein [Planctomycetota bacterium]MBL7009578.1 carboxypeptidase regulatory-like domain-containing protein [Planctomycetota bacterium]